MKTQCRPDADGLLLLSAGSKVALARIAKDAARQASWTLHATDTHERVPARFAADRFHLLPSSGDSKWGDALIELCQARRIGAVVPTRHQDLAPLAKLRPALESLGAVVALSGDEALRVCLDKMETSAFFRRCGLPHPPACLAGAASAQDWTRREPLIAKPARGAGGAGARPLAGPEEIAQLPADWIVQRRAGGQEYTVNLYLSAEGKCLCAIPHRRVVVESGESVQAVTERFPALEAAARAAAEALPGAWGPLNIQAFADRESGAVELIEINPRLGGAFPLAHQARGTFLHWLVERIQFGRDPRPVERWTERLRLYRYRDAFFEIDPVQSD